MKVRKRYCLKCDKEISRKEPYYLCARCRAIITKNPEVFQQFRLGHGHAGKIHKTIKTGNIP